MSSSRSSRKKTDTSFDFRQLWLLLLKIIGSVLFLFLIWNLMFVNTDIIANNSSVNTVTSSAIIATTTLNILRVLPATAAAKGVDSKMFMHNISR